MKNKNDMSGKGIWSAGFGEVIATLQVLENHGITVEHLKAIRSDNVMAKAVVEFIAGYGNKIVLKDFDPNNFMLTVNYSKTLKEMIAAGKYNLISDEVTTKNFPIIKGATDINCKLFHFNRYIISSDAIKEMAKEGYRPATQAELLALGATQPELQRQFPIAALGSIWHLVNCNVVPVLAHRGSQRKLNLLLFNDGWNNRSRFLAVKKVEAFNPESFMLNVDYEKTLKEMIAAGGYDWRNKECNAENFPIQNDAANINCKLFHFNRLISSKDAIREMGNAGYREATVAELLAFGVTYPEQQRQFPIVAIGSYWCDPNKFYNSPVLSYDGSRRRLDLHTFAGNWHIYYRFLAVKITA